jgi:hypothetical protein
VSDAKSPGEQAYDAYGKTTDYKNYQGLPMPAWGDLTDKIREAWENAAGAVVMRPSAPVPAWLASFDDRQQNQIRFARLIIARMAELLDAAS